MPNSMREQIAKILRIQCPQPGESYNVEWWEQKRLSLADQILAHLAAQTDEDALLTPEEQDNCTPSKEEVAAYLAEPDDAAAALLPELIKREVARVVLYGQKISKAQHVKSSTLSAARAAQEIAALKSQRLAALDYLGKANERIEEILAKAAQHEAEAVKDVEVKTEHRLQLCIQAVKNKAEAEQAEAVDKARHKGPKRGAGEGHHISQGSI